ncbi:hypothetical protein BS329_30790 [Amycolatopsis coloradensis]|uniref:Peptidase S1 domain-containing protein n=1 Tax=Amycolatopsis coloradensis TaxID=76021 RepID=A0A1R0KJ44_9PSEU|nr:trypsin-like serine protease [Amycolatopsis coloradensis]OLZ46058.1 hypothetical protein BS329_30790 [Amycolatopsis coloradensis]
MRIRGLLTALLCAAGLATAAPAAGAAPIIDGRYADIALLRLDRSVSTTYSSLGTSVAAGDTEHVYGWGYDEDGDLQRHLKVARMTVTSVGSGLIKAREGDGLTDGGDSGGPVFVGGKQVGVHIAGNKVDSSTHTGIAANRTWIRDTSGV